MKVAARVRGSPSRKRNTTMTTKFTLGLVQMCCRADRDANLDNAMRGIREAASGGADIICLPELFRSLYFCQRVDPGFFELAEPIPGPTTATLGQLARELGTVLVASL